MGVNPCPFARPTERYQTLVIATKPMRLEDIKDIVKRELVVEFVVFSELLQNKIF
jgi:hypothetical protein